MKHFLFDLDGTLLPFDQEEFTKEYFSRLGMFFKDSALEPAALQRGIWAGTDAMIRNDGSMTNEERFWRTMEQFFTEDIRSYEPDFLRFYETDFQEIKALTRPNPAIPECIRLLKEKGYPLYLATNPIFPPAATWSRVRWAGLEPEAFEFITTYDNSSNCKPSLNYYRELLDRFRLNPADCMMVGNDTAEDMCAAELGMETYLITDCMIHRGQTPPAYPHQGTAADFLEFVKALPVL